MIEFRAREDWTASRIALCVTMLEKPNVGASMFFDLTPEIAEKLAADLLKAVKQYRDLDKGAEKDLAPKWQPGQRVRSKETGHRGTIQKTNNLPSWPLVSVQWDETLAGNPTPVLTSSLEEIIE